MTGTKGWVEAVRRLTRAPGYAAAFVVTLGLAIGVNSAVFSVVNAVLIRPLPFDQADRIVYLQQPADRVGVGNALFSFHEVADLREGVDAFDEVVEFGDWTFSIVPVDGGEPHRGIGGLVTSNYFDVLGIDAELGRTTLPEDDRDGAEPVMVLTRQYWTRVHGEDPNVLGRIVELNGKATRIVGVLEEGAHYTGSRRPDFYVNYATNDHYLGASMQDSRTHRMTDVFARLAPGATLESARGQASSLSSTLHAEYPDAYPERMGMTVTVDRWQDELTESARPIFLLLMGTVGVVLLLACANLANLTLTRLIRRQGELATRAALGASAAELRGSLVRENVVLSVAGALLGMVLAAASVGLLSSYAARFTVRAQEVGVDATVFGVTLAVATLVAIGLAWLPGMPVAPAPGSLAVAAGRSTGPVARRRMQSGLVVAQLTLSFTLLAGAGLLVRSLLAMQSVDPGFETENVLTMQAFQSFATQGATVSGDELFEQVEDRLRMRPGVRSVGTADFAPMTGAMRMAWSFRTEGMEDRDDATVTVAMNNVSPGYFDVLGIQLLSGRYFTHMDMADSEPVVIVTESFARSWFGDTDPVGRTLSTSFSGSNWSPPARVVGVVADGRQFGLAEEATPIVYRPAAQAGWGQTLLIAGRGDPLPLVDAAREAIRELDPTRPVDEIRTVDDLMREDVAPARLNATLFGVFSVLALVIASVGVLGVLAFSVTQRTREFGVRMAIGADRSSVLTSVLGDGLRLVAISLVLGIVAAAGLSRFLSGLLFDVEPVDPVSFTIAAALLAMVAMLSALLPALRATRVDPMQALRADG